MLKCDFWLRAQHTAVVEITSWVSLKKTFSVPWDAKYTTTEGQAILFPFLRVQSSSYCKWRDILYIVHNTKCSLSVIYYFLDVEMLLLWLRLRKRDNHLQKKYRKNLSCPPLCKCSFLPLITILQFLGKMAMTTTWDWCLGSQKWV